MGFKPIPGYEEYYSINEYGDVYSHRNKRVLIPEIGSNGYYSIELNVKGKAMRTHVHRLIAFTFLPNPLNLPCVNHKDENKLNNHVSNLEWCTYQYNMNYGTAPARRRKSMEWFYRSEQIRENLKKATAACCKPVAQINPSNGECIATFESAKKAAVTLGISHSHICECCNGKRYKTVGGFGWKYI